MEHRKKVSYISGGSFPSFKNKNKILIFREMELPIHKLKVNLYISGGSFKVSGLKRNLIFFSFFNKISSSYFSYCF